MRSNSGDFTEKYTGPLSEKIKESRGIIEQYSKCNSVVLWSGGKDSTVLLHLVLSINEDCYVLFIDTGVEFKEVLEYIRKIVKKWKIKNFYSIKSKYDPWKLPNSQNKNFLKCTYWLKVVPSLDFLRKKNIDVQFLGDRSEEGPDREKRLNKGLVHKAEISYNLNRNIKNVYPIGYWSRKDIIKYAKLNKIQFCKLEKTLGYTACTICPFHDFDSLKKFYPEIYYNLLKRTGASNKRDLWWRMREIFSIKTLKNGLI